MRGSKHLLGALLALIVPVFLASMSKAADPGLALPNNSEINDQKAGSVLIYNLYTSNALTPEMENTRITITNNNPLSAAFIHIFLVDGASGSPADTFICLTPNQTASFLATNIDPGIRGYLVMIAVSSATGCPINFNFLSGDCYVKFASGHAANLPAEAVSAIAATPAVCGGSSTLNFDGVNYNQLPRTLALDKIRSPGNGNSMLLILNRIGGDLGSGAAILGTVNGELIDDLAASVPFTFTTNAPQRFSTLSDTLPMTAPVFSSFIPAGRTGWMTLFNASDVGILGAMINFNPNTASSALAFRGGHNLRKLTLSTTTAVTMPVFVPPCI